MNFPPIYAIIYTLKYKNNTAHNDETAANLYKFVINFIRYNANTDAQTNQLAFADFKHCRFQVYPNKKQMQNECVKTKQLFEKLGSETQFNELFRLAKHGIHQLICKQKEVL